jgi:hypothetical protein
MLERSSRIAILSDFLGDSDALLASAKPLLAAGSEIYAVHIVASEELEPVPSSDVVTDPEDPSIRRRFRSGEIQRYQDAFQAWREELANEWQSAGAVYQMATTSDRAERIVREIAAPPGSDIRAR